MAGFSHGHDRVQRICTSRGMVELMEKRKDFEEVIGRIKAEVSAAAQASKSRRTGGYHDAITAYPVRGE
jgi:hypothetical protein